MHLFTLVATLAAFGLDPAPDQPRLAALIGEWQAGDGVLAHRLDVARNPEGEIVGRLQSAIDEPNRVRSWTISAVAGELVLDLSFQDGRSVRYTTIPSFANELDFINLAERGIQRVSIVRDDDGDLLLRYFEADQSAGQIRFQRRPVP